MTQIVGTVQVFEGNGQDPVAPVDEFGKPHGTWKSWYMKRVQGERTGSGWEHREVKMFGEVDFDHGKQVGKARVFCEGGPINYYDVLVGFDPRNPGKEFKGKML